MPENTAQNPYVNKVVYGNQTLIDLTGDSVTADKLLKDETAHSKSGAVITGTCEYDSKTTDANATASEILIGKTGYVNKAKVTGSMPDKSGTNVTISDINSTYSIPLGFHDGSGAAIIDPNELAKLVAQNIRYGVQILGVTGSMSGTEDAYAEAKVAIPSTSPQLITADGYDQLESQPDDWVTDFTNYYRKSGNTYVQIEDTTVPAWNSDTFYAKCQYLSQVTVNAIPKSEVDNAAGGKTVTIG